VNLRTELVIPRSSWSLDLKDPLLTLGSCFAATVGNRLAENKFIAHVNPFGTTYHPLAIDRLLSYAVTPDYPPAETYISRDDLWFSYDLHSSLFAEDDESLTEKIRLRVNEVHAFLRRARVLIITWGTAWLYDLAESGRPVANCHRMPSGNFRRRLVNVEEIVESFLRTERRLRSVNPQLKIILTVSPVRHLKDSLQLNSVSKSILRVACHRIQEMVKDVSYFPAFELMMDDLRDYRFYQLDLIHPSTLAEDYIWKRFSETYFSPDVIAFLEQWIPVRQALSHRAFQPASREHQAFLRRTLDELEKLRRTVDVEHEIADLQTRLTTLPVS
jgi:GSCFA family